MGRGHHFNHKEKGHEQKKPQHGFAAAKKETETVQYSIDTVASENEKPITIIKE
ncbi:hypothetical protein [Metabacillus fastidiosus]|uniref:hypothetical protein n=1 Tax=Metabacillus fastidiosus TaxID=1458 RepID=UPI003D278082